MTDSPAPDLRAILPDLPPEFDEAGKYAMREKALRQAPEHDAFGHMSDEWVANRVRMLTRNELWHEPICQAARDRIMRLSLKVAAYEHVTLPMTDSPSSGLTEIDGEKFNLPAILRHIGQIESDSYGGSERTYVKLVRRLIVSLVNERMKLLKQLSDEDRAHTETIKDRDRAEAYADQLADVIAKYTGADIGEHSSANNPWEEAHEAMLEKLAPAADPVPNEG